MKVCKNCGNQLPDYMESCNFCGTPVNGNAPSVQNDSWDQGWNNRQYGSQGQGWNDRQYGSQGQGWGSQQGYQQNTGYYDQSYGYNQQDPYNSYPQQTAAKPKNKAGTIAVILIILFIALGACGAIATMVLTGYYDLSLSSSKPTQEPAVVPESYGNIDRNEVNVSNTFNMSGVVDTGDFYLTITGGGPNKFEIRKYTAESKTGNVLFSSTSIISSLGCYNKRIYFLQLNGEKGCIYSIDMTGSDIKTELDEYDVHSMFIYGSNAYFVSNYYGNTGEAGLVGKLDLKTKKQDIIRVIDYSFVLDVLEYKDQLFIHYQNNSNYRGHLLMAEAKYPSVLTEISPVGGLDENIYSMTVLGGKIYFSNLKNDSFTMYSMDSDGTNVTEVADTGGSYMAGYGDYIFYIKITYGDNENDKKFEVRQIKKDGTGDGYISSHHAMYPGIAGEKIYYYDIDSSSYSWMSFDGQSSGNI